MIAMFQAGEFSLPLDRTYVMGILNVTPDSFSDGGKYLDPAQAVAHALEMKAQGADILDIGGQSTRPGFSPISPEEEWQRIAPVLPAVVKETGLPGSVDTWSWTPAGKGATSSPGPRAFSWTGSRPRNSWGSPGSGCALTRASALARRWRRTWP